MEISPFVPVALAILGFIPLYIDLIDRRLANRRISFEIERYYDTPKEHPESDFYGIRILQPSRSIDHCRVFVNETQLAFVGGDYTDTDYERKIPKAGGGNVIVPDDVYDAKAWVRVKDGKKTLKRIRLGDIPDVGLQ